MKYFYLILLVLFCFIVLLFFNKIVEGFTQINTKTYILLGDSILQNNSYVLNGKSIEMLIAERNQKVFCFAEDNSKIVDVYSQINKIPNHLNSSNTFVFLSVGGNDILSHYIDQNQDITNDAVLHSFFFSYKNLVKSIQTKLPNAKIILLNIYYPNNVQYKKFHLIIQKWNNMLYDFYKNPINKIYDIIQISKHLLDKEDFSFGIEPSSIGGKKIADLIVAIY
jgi:hypothetical protein